MVQVNENYLKLKAGYLFPEIAKRVKIYSQSNKSAEIIKLGIGDVTEPLPRACIEAMGKALDDMGTTDGFRYFFSEPRITLFWSITSKTICCAHVI